MTYPTFTAYLVRLVQEVDRHSVSNSGSPHLGHFMLDVGMNVSTPGRSCAWDFRNQIVGLNIFSLYLWLEQIITMSDINPSWKEFRLCFKVANQN